MDCWIFHDWRPLFWVITRLRSLYTLPPSQNLSPVTLGLTDTFSAPGAWTQPDGPGAVTQPHSFLRNRPRKSSAAGSVATALGEGARPCLRHSDPTGLCAPPWIQRGSAPRKRNLGSRPLRRPGYAEHAQPQSPPVTVPPAQQWFSPRRRQTISEPGNPGTIPLARQRGSHPRAGPGRYGNKLESARWLGGGAIPGSLSLTPI